MLIILHHTALRHKIPWVTEWPICQFGILCLCLDQEMNLILRYLLHPWLGECPLLHRYKIRLWHIIQWATQTHPTRAPTRTQIITLIPIQWTTTSPIILHRPTLKRKISRVPDPVRQFTIPCLNLESLDRETKFILTIPLPILPHLRLWRGPGESHTVLPRNQMHPKHIIQRVT